MRAPGTRQRDRGSLGKTKGRGLLRSAAEQKWSTPLKRAGGHQFIPKLFLNKMTHQKYFVYLQ